MTPLFRRSLVHHLMAMLQPRSYPTLIGKALVLEPDAFATMAHDDAPVVEAAFLTTLIGVLVGAAQVVGGVVFSWTMPPAASIAALVGRAVDQLTAAGLPAAARTLESAWLTFRFFTGYDTGWARLLPLLWMPFLLLALWLAAGLLSFLVGRALGGSGSLARVLGASSLAIAPHLLLLVTALAVPGVNGLLLAVWGTLLLYRAVQVAHDLAWPQAAATALIAALLIGILGALIAGPAGILLVLR